MSLSDTATSIRTYSELISLPTYHERFEYLQLEGSVGEDTFGFDRYLNQYFYHTPEWRHFRRQMIIRDKGCDMALDGAEIHGLVYLHHLNPLTKEDVLNRSEALMNPENVVCMSEKTHKAIHYGTEPPQVFPERSANDTCPWKKTI